LNHRYIEMLLLYALASYGAILVFVEGILWIFRKRILATMENLRPADGILAHLVLRVFPPLLALMLTCLSAVPGYFIGEPVRTQELPGPLLVGLGWVGLYAIAAPILSTISSAIRTSLRARSWLKRATGTESFSDIPVVEFEARRPVILAAGFLWKRIFVSKPVRGVLSTRELRAALKHEVSHCRRYHNLAKLISGFVPRLISTDALDANFREMIEYAADDDACSAPGDALNLASALLIMARQRVPIGPQVLFAPLIDSRETVRLKRRVERLVQIAPRSNGEIFSELAATCSAIVALVSFVGAMPPAQHLFREGLELLVR
jgi:Zn-dependent protease with chaperone function